MKTIAAILAAGKGIRAGFDVPKQLVSAAGHPLVWHSLRTFQDSPLVDRIVVVTSAECRDLMMKIVEEGGFSKVGTDGIVRGGETRGESTLSAIRFCDAEIGDVSDAKLLIHDAARPLATGRMIADCVAALETYDAVTTAVPMTDTVAVVGDDGLIEDIPSRKKMFAVQTPQGFRLSILERACELAEKDPDFEATDDCGVVLKYLPGAKVGIVPGDVSNIKLTHRSDLVLIEQLLVK